MKNCDIYISVISLILLQILMFCRIVIYKSDIYNNENTDNINIHISI